MMIRFRYLYKFFYEDTTTADNIFAETTYKTAVKF